MVGMVGKQAAKHLEDDLRKTCFQGGQDCLYLGRFLETVRQDVHQAGSIYVTTCNSRLNGESCFRYAQLLHTGQIGNVDHRQAYDYNCKGCEFGYAKACLSAGLANISGNRKIAGIGVDYGTAAKFLEKACILENGLSCYLLAGMYLTGVADVKPDAKLALKYDFQACQLGFPLACSNFLGRDPPEERARSKNINGLVWRLEQIKHST